MSIFQSLPNDMTILTENEPISLGILEISHDANASIALTLEVDRPYDKISVGDSTDVTVQKSENSITFIGTVGAVNRLLASTTFTPVGIMSHNITVSAVIESKQISGQFYGYIPVRANTDFTLTGISYDLAPEDGIVPEGNWINAYHVDAITGISNMAGGYVNPDNGAAVFDQDLSKVVYTASDSGLFKFFIESSDGNKDYNTNISIKINSLPQLIAKDAVVDNATVSQGEYILNYGVTKNTQLSGGVENVYSGAVSQNAVLVGGSQIIGPGGTAKTASITSGIQTITSNGVTNFTTVFSGGAQYVRSGGSALNTTVYSGGSQAVYSGGVTSNVLISSGGSQSVLNGGSAYNVTVSSGGVQYVSSGGYVSGGQVYAGGSHIAATGARVVDFVIGGYSPDSNTTTTPIVPEGGLQRDVYETNDTLAKATAITSSGSVSGLTIHNSSDVDYFKFNLTGKGTANNFVKISLTSGSGDLNMRLFDSGGNLIQSSTTTSSVENLSLNGLNAGVYYAQIYGYNGASGGYSMNWNVKGSSPVPPPTPPSPVIIGLQRDAYETNDTLAKATAITSSGSVSGLTIHNSSDVDYFKFNLTGKGTANNFVKISLTSGSGDLNMRLFDSGGNLIQSSTTTSPVENLSLNGLNAGVYYAQIYGYNGASGGYSMNWNVKGSSPVPPPAPPSGGVQIVGAGARTSRVTLQAGGSQRVMSGGYAYLTQISGGVQTVSRGGLASNTRISGGSQAITSGGSASCTFIYKGGTQRVYNKGKAVSSYISGGKQVVSKGGSAINTRVESGGAQTVSRGGLASNTRISGGSQAITSGGSASCTFIYKGGTQRVYNKGKAASSYISGGKQVVSKGGSAINTSVKSGGAQYVYGVASQTLVSAGAQQIVYKGAAAASACIYNSGRQTIYGATKYGAIYAGGAQIIASGGKATGVLVKGSSIIKKGGVSQDPVINGVVTASAGAKVNFTKASVISGRLNISGGSVIGANSASLTLARNGVINMAANGRISAPVVNIGSGTLNITGAGNAVRKIGSVAKSRTMFNIGAVNVKSVTPMLKTTANVNLAGSMTIQSVKNQKIGVYELTSNITRYAPVYLKINNTYKTFAINPGSSRTASGMTYKLVKSGKSLNLSVTIKQGKAIKGTSRSESLNGTANSDIFYGGKGNDVIRGNGGRDVAVYDRNNWGQDVIANTNGTMTILFNGVKSSEVSKTRVGSDMIINRKSDPSQQITVRNWDTQTHNIVFGGALGQFSKYAAAGKPTAAQTANASREVWKKTGLLA